MGISVLRVRWFNHLKHCDGYSFQGPEWPRPALGRYIHAPLALVAVDDDMDFSIPLRELWQKADERAGWQLVRCSLHGGSGINQVVEETGEKGREGVLFGAEELGLSLAHLATLRRVAVIGIVGDGDVFARLFEFIG